MKRKTLTLLCLAAILCGACSSSAHMPKHRKRRHCNCPTFSESMPGQTADAEAARWSQYIAER